MVKPLGRHYSRENSADPKVHEAHFNRAVGDISRILSREFGVVIPANKVENMISKKFVTLALLFHEAHDAKKALENPNNLST